MSKPEKVWLRITDIGYQLIAEKVCDTDIAYVREDVVKTACRTAEEKEYERHVLGKVNAEQLIRELADTLDGLSTELCSRCYLLVTCAGDNEVIPCEPVKLSRALIARAGAVVKPDNKEKK